MNKYFIANILHAFMFITGVYILKNVSITFYKAIIIISPFREFPTVKNHCNSVMQ